MNVVFRCDASLQMGSGHVMRCLTLADALRAQGGECHFICREHQGNLIEFIRQRGYTVIAFPARPEYFQPDAGSAPPVLAHAAWLGCDWSPDAKQSQSVLEQIQPDWLVVDHYALDSRWETALRPYCRKLMVIDDLADRHHDCDVLLDQNLGSTPSHYQALVPAGCRILVGTNYALLRPEFAEWRPYSLARRKSGQLHHILITMGGVDLPNATARVLSTLKQCVLPKDCRITVVMGEQSPWLQQVHFIAATMPWPTQVLCNIADMAHRMADSDLAIGAAGSTSWERCCLGLPAILICLADNQRVSLRQLSDVGAALAIDQERIEVDLGSAMSALSTHQALSTFSLRAALVTDGLGVNRVRDVICE